MKVQNQVGRAVSLFDAVSVKPSESRSGGSSSFEAFLEKTGAASPAASGGIEAIKGQSPEDESTEQETESGAAEEDGGWYCVPAEPASGEQGGEEIEPEAVDRLSELPGLPEPGMTPVMMMTLVGNVPPPVMGAVVKDGPADLFVSGETGAGRSRGAGWASYGTSAPLPLEPLGASTGPTEAVLSPPVAATTRGRDPMASLPASLLAGMVAGESGITGDELIPEHVLMSGEPLPDGAAPPPADPAMILEAGDSFARQVASTPFLEQFRAEVVRGDDRVLRGRDRVSRKTVDVLEEGAQARDLHTDSAAGDAHPAAALTAYGVPAVRAARQGDERLRADGFEQHLRAQSGLEESEQAVPGELAQSESTGSLFGSSPEEMLLPESVPSGVQRRDDLYGEAWRLRPELELRPGVETRFASVEGLEVRPAEQGDWASRVRVAIDQALGGQREASQRAVVDMQDPELGRMRIEVTLDAGRIKVDVWAEQDTARQLLRDSKHVLQEELARQQYQLEQFNVGSGPGRDGGEARYRSPFDREETGLRGVGGLKPSPAPTARVSHHDGELDTIV